MPLVFFTVNTRENELLLNIQKVVNRFRSCPDTESEQGAIRLLVILAIIAYLYLVGAYQVRTGDLFYIFSWIAFLNGIVIISWIYINPQKSIVRRVYALFSDNIFISTLLGVG